MYRQRIRDQYDHLSRSYRKVADFILSRYFEVSFMTAAQLAYVVDVDTTTVVRFSQRLGYDGYPELLHEIREQVKAEIYSAYETAPVAGEDPGSVFARRAELERHAINQMMVHNPPDHIAVAVQILDAARRVLFVADGYGEVLATLGAQQLSQLGKAAIASSNDPAQLAGALSAMEAGDVVVGISGSENGREVARLLGYARSRGIKALAIVGSLANSANRMSDLVLYAPVSDPGPLPGVVVMAAALSGLIYAYATAHVDRWVRTEEVVAEAFSALTQPDASEPDDEAS